MKRIQYLTSALCAKTPDTEIIGSVAEDRFCIKSGSAVFEFYSLWSDFDRFGLNLCVMKNFNIFGRIKNVEFCAEPRIKKDSRLRSREFAYLGHDHDIII